MLLMAGRLEAESKTTEVDDVIGKQLTSPSVLSHSNPKPHPQSENSHNCPLKLGRHVHVKPPGVLPQVPPFSHIGIAVKSMRH